MFKKSYDCIVIGGGVTGTGTARDLAMRGVKVLLLEKRDFAGGTSGTASGMIHGGLRYLTYDIQTTKLSCLDSGYIQKIAPNLIFRIPFVFPVLSEGLFSRIYLELIEAFFLAYDQYQSLKGGKPHIRLNREQALALEPGLTPDLVGAVTMDEWGIDTFRLSALNALAAAEHGCDVANHCEVLALLREGQSVVGVKVLNKLTGEVAEVRSGVVVNAAGPWAPEVAALAGVELKLRPAKGIHLVFDRRLVNTAIIITAIDGRSLFLQPHENTSLLGTTDDDYYGNLNDVNATQDEIEYLLQAAERVFPDIRRARIIRVMAGIRPTLFQWGPIEDRLSREHEIVDHSSRDAVARFVSIVGGKLASYRVMAEELTDHICAILGRAPVPCSTHSTPLPGNDRPIDLKGLATRYGIPEYVVQRLQFRHGSRTEAILAQTDDHPEWRQVICTCESVTEAEIRYVVQHEWVSTLDDLRRRTRFGMGPCQSCSCVVKGALILGDELKSSAKAIQQYALDFLQARWKGKRPIVMRGQMAQESLARAMLFCAGNLREALL